MALEHPSMKYSNNGTGKSTIAESFRYHIDNNPTKLKSLKSYGANLEQRVSILDVDEDGKEVEGEVAVFTHIEVFK